MKTKISIICFLLVVVLCGVYSCTKDVGLNPDLAFNDRALYDSCKNISAFVYYKNNPNAVLSGANGPHGAFKLRFNKIAYASLTDNGKLPINAKFPNGSMIVKDVQSNGQYVLMYKKSDSWLWAEINLDGSVAFSVLNNPTGPCIGCHSQTGQRDLVVSFNFH